MLMLGYLPKKLLKPVNKKYAGCSLSLCFFWKILRYILNSDFPCCQCVYKNTIFTEQPVNEMLLLGYLPKKLFKPVKTC